VKEKKGEGKGEKTPYNFFLKKIFFFLVVK